MLPPHLGFRGVRVGEASNPGPVSDTGESITVPEAKRDVLGNMSALWLITSGLFTDTLRNSCEWLNGGKPRSSQSKKLRSLRPNSQVSVRLCHRTRLFGGSGPPWQEEAEVASLRSSPENPKLVVCEEGQFLSVQMFGMSEPWVIHCDTGYRRPRCFGRQTRTLGFCLRLE